MDERVEKDEDGEEESGRRKERRRRISVGDESGCIVN